MNPTTCYTLTVSVFSCDFDVCDAVAYLVQNIRKFARYSTSDIARNTFLMLLESRFLNSLHKNLYPWWLACLTTISYVGQTLVNYGSQCIILHKMFNLLSCIDRHRR